MNKLDSITRARVISCLIEGCSVRSTVRITGIAKKTVLRLLVEVGQVCADYQDRVFRGLRCRRLQLDELWALVYCKEKNVTAKIAAEVPGAGDIRLWAAIDADTKLVPSFMLGNRDAQTANAFVDDLASRLASRVQITTDGLKRYVEAIEGAFGANVDYAMLVKMYESMQDETRYGPAKCVACESKRVMGNPDMKHVSTSFVERHNWTVRTNSRRYSASQTDSRARLKTISPPLL